MKSITFWDKKEWHWYPDQLILAKADLVGTIPWASPTHPIIMNNPSLYQHIWRWNKFAFFWVLEIDQFLKKLICLILTYMQFYAMTQSWIFWLSSDTTVFTRKWLIWFKLKLNKDYISVRHFMPNGIWTCKLVTLYIL